MIVFEEGGEGMRKALCRKEASEVSLEGCRGIEHGGDMHAGTPSTGRVQGHTCVVSNWPCRLKPGRPGYRETASSKLYYTFW